ncbi:MAG: hypothetical protein Q4D52_00035 [Eubacteriales bacterium]|nr:hypothetical protein [Eubacteriales bacterium]
MKRMSWSKGLMILLLILVAGAFAGCKSKTKVDLEKVVKMTYEGIDTKGRATAEIDTDLVMETYFAKEKKPAKALRLSALFWGMHASLDKKENLKNGDEITVTFSFDEKEAKDLGVVFTGNPVKVKVSGLKEAKEVDPFKDIKVHFSGISPDISAEIINNSSDSFIADLYVSLDRSYNLKVGDKVVAEVMASEWELEDKGYVLTSTTKEFTVEGVDEYVKKYADIADTVKARMDQEVTDHFDAEMADEYDYTNWFYPEDFVSSSDAKDRKNEPLKLVKIYFLSMKEGLDSWGVNNQLLYIYESKSTNSHSPDGVTVYVGFKINDIVKAADGTGSFDVKSFGTATWDTYEKLEDLVAETVNSQKADYVVEEVPVEKK